MGEGSRGKEGGKWGKGGREVGEKGEGSGDKGGGKWGVPTPLSSPSITEMTLPYQYCSRNFFFYYYYFVCFSLLFDMFVCIKCKEEVRGCWVRRRCPVAFVTGAPY